MMVILREVILREDILYEVVPPLPFPRAIRLWSTN